MFLGRNSSTMAQPEIEFIDPMSVDVLSLFTKTHTIGKGKSEYGRDHKTSASSGNFFCVHFSDQRFLSNIFSHFK